MSKIKIILKDGLKKIPGPGLSLPNFLMSFISMFLQKFIKVGLCRQRCSFLSSENGIWTSKYSQNL